MLQKKFNNISVVIITHNEEKNIGRCLNSVIDFSDNIIVVDSYSNDNTKKICEQFVQVRFIEKKWEGYGAVKNFGNSQAKYDWILSLDADEEVSTELKKNILDGLDVVQNSAFVIKRKNNYCGKWIRFGKWGRDKSVRLFNKKACQWNLDMVHEKIICKNKVLVKQIKGPIYHYTLCSIQEHIQKIKKYSDLSAQKMQQHGKKSSFLKKYISPVYKFLSDYFFRLGFLDGFYGLIIAALTAYEVHLKYSKLNSFRLKK